VGEEWVRRFFPPFSRGQRHGRTVRGRAPRNRGEGSRYDEQVHEQKDKNEDAHLVFFRFSSFFW